MGHLPIPVKRHDGITQYRQELYHTYLIIMGHQPLTKLCWGCGKEVEQHHAEGDTQTSRDVNGQPCSSQCGVGLATSTADQRGGEDLHTKDPRSCECNVYYIIFIYIYIYTYIYIYVYIIYNISSMIYNISYIFTYNIHIYIYT